ncbi:cyanate lyase C-terminal domain-containing protein, partial [Vararia minispora EC-137]
EAGPNVGRDEVWVAALMHAQAKGTDRELTALGRALGINPEEIKAQLGGHWVPQRGIGPIPPTDPVLYRLFEGVLVYGQPIKAVIHEKFGDGIMSMIDCNVTVDRQGDRVRLVFDGKFLPYSRW